MDSQRLLIWICFFFCVALSAGGALVFFQKKEIKSVSASKYLQYFLILIYTFGFYSMWSKIFLQLLFEITDQKQLANVPQYLSLIGTPFLIIGMFMLIVWAVNLLQRKPHGFFLPAVSLIVFLILLVYITYKRFDLLVNVSQVYALFVFMITACAALLLLFSEVRYLDKKPKTTLILLIFLSGAIHIPVFLGSLVTLSAEVIFIFLFFLVNTSTGIYYAYTVKGLMIDQVPVSFDLFIKEFGITAREFEIIQEIYSGKTNQEIADKLFVTVQTIKDHTSRIYLKTNMKNRAQLTSYLRRYE